MRHSDRVKGFDGSLRELAGAVGNMTYDQVAVFIQELSDNLRDQAAADVARGRMKLAAKLYSTTTGLDDSANKMVEVWQICKPFMKD
jgi:hypothetical protein